jgi:hypothetical protein
MIRCSERGNDGELPPDATVAVRADAVAAVLVGGGAAEAENDGTTGAIVIGALGADGFGWGLIAAGSVERVPAGGVTEAAVGVRMAGSGSGCVTVAGFFFKR